MVNDWPLKLDTEDEMEAVVGDATDCTSTPSVMMLAPLPREASLLEKP